jgi:hypothetical protein
MLPGANGLGAVDVQRLAGLGIPGSMDQGIAAGEQSFELRLAGGEQIRSVSDLDAVLVRPVRQEAAGTLNDAHAVNDAAVKRLIEGLDPCSANTY